MKFLKGRANSGMSRLDLAGDSDHDPVPGFLKHSLFTSAIPILAPKIKHANPPRSRFELSECFLYP